MARPHPARPYVVCSVAMSLDGCIDDASAERLLLSGAADFDRVDEVRAGVDAILVGAATIRADDPRLLVRSPQRRAERVRQGRPESPSKVTLTGRGNLDPAARFFTTGVTEKIVYTGSGAHAGLAARLGAAATVVDAGEPLALDAVLGDLAGRGVARLLVEGGTAAHTLFLTAGAVDELHVAIAPFLVGDPAAPRFVGPGRFPQNSGRRMELTDVRRLGDLAVLSYRPMTAPAGSVPPVP